jgi:hypothetical protein
MDIHNPFFMLFFMYFMLRMNGSDIFYQNAKFYKEKICEYVMHIDEICNLV